MCLSLLATPPAMAKLDVVRTALRTLRIAERADKASRTSEIVKVQSEHIVDGSIVTADLADGAVIAGKLAGGAVSAAHLQDGAVAAAKLAAGAVTSGALCRTGANREIVEVPHTSADRDLHIYGSGKDRRVIVSCHRDRDDDTSEAAKDTKQDPKLESGGVPAPATGT